MEFNKILQPRFSGLLTRYFAIRGAGSPAPTLAPEIAPSFDVNQQDDPAAYYTRGDRLCSAGTQVSAVAASTSKVQLLNPAGSGTLIIVKQYMYFSTTSGQVSLFNGSTALTGGVQQNAAIRDLRWYPVGSQPSPVGQIWTAADGLAIPGRVCARPAAGQTDPQTLELVLPPGGGAIFSALTVNTAIASFSVEWVERTLSNEELGTG